jgi:cytochrome c-type biogenesis protein CcmH
MPKSKIKAAALFILLSGVVLPQTSSVQYVTPEIRRVGDKLACKCGSCNNTVATCQMLQCHYSEPAREKIAKMQANGASDQGIIDSFVQESGLSALASPPTTGFHLLGYIMPFIVIALGLGAIGVWMKRFRGSNHVLAPATPESQAASQIDERYRARIEKEMAELD